MSRVEKKAMHARRTHVCPSLLWPLASWQCAIPIINLNELGYNGGSDHGAACIAFHCSNMLYILEQRKAIHAAPW